MLAFDLRLLSIITFYKHTNYANKAGGVRSTNPGTFYYCKIAYASA